MEKPVEGARGLPELTCGASGPGQRRSCLYQEMPSRPERRAAVLSCLPAGLCPRSLGWELGPPLPQLLSLAVHHAATPATPHRGRWEGAAAAGTADFPEPKRKVRAVGAGGGGASPRKQCERSGRYSMLPTGDVRHLRRCPCLPFPLGPLSAMCRAGGGVGQISVDSV